MDGSLNRREAGDSESLGEAGGFLRYWGKAGGDGDPRCFHPLACHGLDVAAVGLALADMRPAWMDTLAATAGLRRPELQSAVAFLLAMHDLGKFGDGFQRLRPDVAAALGRAPAALANQPRHDTLGYILWSEFADPRGIRTAPVVRPCLVDDSAGALRDSSAKEVLLPWIAAVTGHHGRPPGGEAHAASILRAHLGFNRSDGAWVDTLAFVEEARLLLQPASMSCRPGLRIDEATLKTSSWWLAGYATLCDWIGSNSEWFPFEPEVRDIRAYWPIALARAQRAVEAAGLRAPHARAFAGFEGLFPAIVEPSPLQLTASSVQLGEGPQLFLLEDMTGAGKTEAALTLASRLMAAGKADGFYFALPTMATANAMFTRVEAVVDRFFAGSPRPSLLLAHSGPGLHSRTDGMGAEILERQRGSSYDSEEATASESARDWLRDNRKKALLADAGIGTIDQALTAVLRARHNSLRLLGLHHHVLVVDEVHACDDYMNGLLVELLRAQAASGGSAVLLSATLPMGTRHKLVGSFCSGLATRARVVESDAYPLLVHADGAGIEAIAVTARRGSERDVAIEFVDGFTTAAQWCCEVARAGKCVAWIRNTVRDALEAAQWLEQELGGDVVRVFHARFPIGDRLEIEQDIVRRFGSAGDEATRKGRVVVATQVLEQSLDIDFDEMISDLAPIDRLIQRAGRLHRHARGARGVPTLRVLAPPWAERPAPDWPGDGFAGTVAVYERPTRLWRTQQVLRAEGRIELPSKARALVEAVYGNDDGAVPANLLGGRRDLNGYAAQLRKRAMAQHNKIRLEHGYLRTGADWADEEFVPTRLGDPTRMLRLVRASAGGLAPWSDSDDVAPSVRWRLGEVSVRTTLVSGGHPDEDVALRARLAALGAEPPEHVVPIEMHPAGEEWRGRGLAARGQDAQVTVTIVYTTTRGLEFRVEKGS